MNAIMIMIYTGRLDGGRRITKSGGYRQLSLREDKLYENADR